MAKPNLKLSTNQTPSPNLGRGEGGEGLPVMNPAQAAAYLGLSETNVREMLRAGKIPHQRSGSRYLIGREALDQWLGAKPAGDVGPGAKEMLMIFLRSQMKTIADQLKELEAK